MSYDFAIAVRTRPKPDSIESFGRAAGVELSMSGAFRAGSNVLVTFGHGDRRTIDVDGPSAVESDDLPDDLAGVVPKARWLVEIHLPGGFDSRSDATALDLAIHLAREGDGAVFDPQLDRIAWPSGVTPRPRGSTEERIRVVELDWIIPSSRLPSDAPRQWVEVASSFPPAMPVRFGGHEPLQGRLDRDGVDGFATAFAEQASRPFGGSLFWSAARDGFGGSAFFADRRQELRPFRLGRVSRITASFDARPIHRDPAQCAALVEFFAAVATEFGAAYGAGYVTRDAILARGRLSADARSESGPMPRSAWWVGLPALPTWLAWFGEPYGALVADAMPAGTVPQRPGGLLAQFGPGPMDVDELRAVVPALPPELLARPRDGATVDPAARITLMRGAPSQPAEVIPWID